LAKDFILLGTIYTLSEPIQHPVRWVLGTFSTGVMWSGCKVHYTSPSSAKIKNKQSYTSVTPLDITFTVTTIWRVCYATGQIF